MIEAWAYAARCARCGERTVGEVPAGLEPARTFGPRIEALLAYLHHGHHLSYERLVAVCSSVFGLRLSEGAIAAALARLATRAEPEVEAIREAVRASPGYYSPTHVGRDVFVNPEWALAHSRCRRQAA